MEEVLTLIDFGKGIRPFPEKKKNSIIDAMLFPVSKVILNVDYRESVWPLNL